MSSEGLWGVVFGLVTAFFIGLFMVPRQYAKSDNPTFLLGLMAGATVGTFVYWVVAGMPFQWSWAALFSLVPGANWAAGSYASGTGRIGLAKATGIKNTQVVITTLGGFLIFGEGATTEPVLATIGSGLVVATAVYLSRVEHSRDVVPRASLKGYLIPIVASFLYGLNGLFMKMLIIWKVPLPQENLGIGVGALLGGAAIYAAKGKRFGDLGRWPKRDHIFALVGGLIWAVALITMLLSIEYAGLAVAWSLMNLSVVVSVLYGVVVLKEIDLRSRWGHVAIGLLLACLGVIALYYSKALPVVKG
jgi:glucose uptake protein GlcU